MNIVYTATAVDDLDAISDYLEPRNAQAAEKVAMAIEQSIERLRTYPFLGRAQDEPDVRKLVEPTFGYLVYYRSRVGDDVLYILSIQHPARERPFSDA